MKTERYNAVDTSELVKARMERRARGCDPTVVKLAEPRRLGVKPEFDVTSAGLDADLGDEFVRLLAGGAEHGAGSPIFIASNKLNSSRREIVGTNPFFSLLNKQEKPNSVPVTNTKVSLSLDTETHGKLAVTASFDGSKISMTIGYPMDLSLAEKNFVSKIVSVKLSEIFNMSVEVING